MSKAHDCIAAIRALGHIGYVKGTTLFGPALVGLRASARGVEISDLWVSPSARGEGPGVRILRTCIEQAYFHNVHLWVRPCPFDRTPGDMNKAALRAWYARHGFEPFGLDHMVRLPDRFDPSAHYATSHAAPARTPTSTPSHAPRSPA